MCVASAEKNLTNGETIRGQSNTVGYAATIATQQELFQHALQYYHQEQQTNENIQLNRNGDVHYLPCRVLCGWILQSNPLCF